ncbi:SDR family oxidoreductase [Dactylosporangium sp. AC04546]|uniref:SDR family oxidoreductase n=1 Tax=Dactylosporangium sp. AC04546 TaxID=2862460 RepID=UPI001EE03B29|nr:SDR family oxidoreductase [Dactylosporangium sp. AC04546]WVK88512.1 SDR family oxidoreductase [Dactylosporangium sp. AC04546]
MRIAVIGGHGKVALLLAPLLVAAGDTVTAIHRNPAHAADVTASGARSLTADVEHIDVSKLTDLLAGHDAIVWSAGAGGGNPPRTYAVDRDAAIRSMDAAPLAGVRRYVMVSYFGARTDHGVAPDNGFFPYAEAKAAADEHLRHTALEWTILGPSRLTEGPPTGGLETAAEGAANGTVTRADVAATIVATLHDPATIGRTIRFNNGPTPIPEALRT